MHNIMVDLEALDSRRTAIVVSIGAVYFDNTGLGDELYLEITNSGFADQHEKGRTFSFDTFAWWMAQGDEARKVFLPNKDIQRVSPAAMLHAFTAFCPKTFKVWGNGVDYDNVVLRDMYETYNIGAPWSYGNNRCYRTMKNLLGNKAKLSRVGAHHNGLDDAKTQALHLIEMCNKVGIQL